MRRLRRAFGAGRFGQRRFGALAQRRCAPRREHPFGAELDRALAVGPSYVACGAVFATTTKTMPTAPQGLDNLRRYVAQAGDTPTVAIGGINLDNARAVLDTGVSSLAVVRAVTEAEDPAAVVKAFQALWPS